MFSSIGIPGLILILVIALVIFGPSKLPEIGRAMGRTINEFRKSTKEIVDDVTESADLKATDKPESKQVK